MCLESTSLDLFFKLRKKRSSHVVAARKSYIFRHSSTLNKLHVQLWKSYIFSSLSNFLYFSLTVTSRCPSCTTLFKFLYTLVILCCVFVLFVFVLCTLHCQFLWIVHFWFPHSIFSNAYFYIINIHILTKYFVEWEHLQRITSRTTSSTRHSR